MKPMQKLKYEELSPKSKKLYLQRLAEVVTAELNAEYREAAEAHERARITAWHRTQALESELQKLSERRDELYIVTRERYEAEEHVAELEAVYQGKKRAYDVAFAEALKAAKKIAKQAQRQAA
jgi:hypothetical protein